MVNFLADFFDLDFDSTSGEGVGNTLNCYTSSCANYINFQPDSYIFTPTGMFTVEWFKRGFLSDILISVPTYEQYIVQELYQVGYPVTDIDSEKNTNSQLVTVVTLSDGNTVTTTNGVVV